MVGRADQRLEVEQLEQRGQVQLVLVHRLQAAEHARKRLRDLVGGLHVQVESADGDRSLQRSVSDVQEGQTAAQDRQHRPR